MDSRKLSNCLLLRNRQSCGPTWLRKMVPSRPCKLVCLCLGKRWNWLKTATIWSIFSLVSSFSMALTTKEGFTFGLIQVESQRIYLMKQVKKSLTVSHLEKTQKSLHTSNGLLIKNWRYSKSRLVIPLQLLWHKMPKAKSHSMDLDKSMSLTIMDKPQSVQIDGVRAQSLCLELSSIKSLKLTRN